MEFDLPKDFIKIAESTTCKIEMIEHKFKKIFGIQFHPEVSNEIGKEIIEQFIGL